MNSAPWPLWWARKWWTSRYGVERTATMSPRTSARHEERDDNDDDEDRQRRAHEQPEEHHGRHLDGAEPTSDCERADCQRGFLLDFSTV